MAETVVRRDPSQFFIGGEFARAAQGLPLRVLPTPSGLAGDLGQVEVLIRDGLLEEYYRVSNGLIDIGEIDSPVAHLDRRTGTIVNPGRAQRPQGESLVPIVPGNEHMTPPPLLLLRQVRSNDSEDAEDRMNSNDWLIRVFPNAYAYGYPRREIRDKEEGGTKRVEKVCTLSLVAALNPEKMPLHHKDNVALMELLLFALSTTSRLIMEQADYLDLEGNNAGRKRFDAVLMFINQGKDAGGSLPWPHAQIIALPRENTQPLYLGDEKDENGNCGRCKGSNEKIDRKDKRVIRITDNVLVYAPFSDGVSKGKGVRVSPLEERHKEGYAANFDAALGHLPTFRDLANQTNKVMRRLATLQAKSGLKEPSYNVVFAQDIATDSSHLFIDIRSGIPTGGFGIVVPVYRGIDGFIKPDVIYQHPTDTAAEFREE